MLKKEYLKPTVFAFFTMCDGFNHGALQIAVAQICQSMGWDALQKSTHDLLTDVLQKYLEEIAKSAHGYCQLCKVYLNSSVFVRVNWEANVVLNYLNLITTQNKLTAGVGLLFYASWYKTLRHVSVRNTRIKCLILLSQIHLKAQTAEF